MRRSAICGIAVLLVAIVAAPLSYPAVAQTGISVYIDGQPVSFDMPPTMTQGRVLVPQVLRESARVTGDVVVFGKLNFLEVANHDLFKAKLDAEPMTAEDEAALASFGL